MEPDLFCTITAPWPMDRQVSCHTLLSVSGRHIAKSVDIDFAHGMTIRSLTRDPAGGYIACSNAEIVRLVPVLPDNRMQCYETSMHASHINRARIIEFNPQGEERLYGEFNFPKDVLPLDAERLMVADSGNNRLVCCGRDGATLWAVECPGSPYSIELA